MIFQKFNEKIRENVIYEKLKKVVLERSLNEDFLQEFLKANLYVKAKKENGSIRFEVVNNELLAFTSPDCLSRADQKLNEYLVIDARSLLKSIPEGHSLVLNSGQNYGKIFLYNEIQDILTGRLPESATRRFEIKQKTNVLIGQPKEYPVALVECLIEHMSRDGDIDRAYLVWVKLENERMPHAMVGIKFNQNAKTKYDEVVLELGEISHKKIKKGEYVDFIEIKENLLGVTEYMVHKTKPFYDRERDFKSKNG